MKILSLTYFDHINGPRVLLHAPETFEGNLHFLADLMDLDQEGYFEYEHEEYNCANYCFEVPNPLARGGHEMFMASLILVNEGIEPDKFRGVLENLVEEIQKIEHREQGCNDSCKNYTEEKFEEIKAVVNSTYDQLPQETVLLDKNVKILIFGYPGAGKTSFIRYINNNLYNYNHFRRNITAKRLFFNNLRMTSYELPIKKEFGKLWRYYTRSQEGYIFILDPLDQNRFPMIKKDLGKISELSKKLKKPLLILFNKMDLKVPPLEILMDELGILSLKNRKLKYFPISLREEEGVFEAFDWIANKILKNILSNGEW